MNEFVILKTSLEKSIADLKENIGNLEGQYSKANELQEIISHIYNEQMKLILPDYRKKALAIYPDLFDAVKIIDKLSDYVTFLNLRQYDKINSEFLSEFLGKFEFSAEEINTLKNELAFCKELKDIITDDFDDEMMKQEYMKSHQVIISLIDSCYRKSINYLITELKKRYNSDYENDLSSYLNRIDVFKDNIELLEKMNNVFDENGLVSFFKDKELLEKFYEWIKENIDIEAQIKIIMAITKYGLKIKLSLGSSSQDDIDNTIEHNRQAVLEELQEETRVESPITFENLDLSKFTSSEQEIIKQVKLIYNVLCQNSERCTFINQDNSKTVNREEYYFDGKWYNWECVLSDIEENLLPNIYKDKELVFNAFNLIIKLYSRRESEINKIESDFSIVSGYADAFTPFMRYLEKYNSQYDYYVENNYDKTSDVFKYQPSMFEYVHMCYYLKHTVEPFLKKLNGYRENYSECLEKNSILVQENAADLENLKVEFESIMLECQRMVEVYRNAEQERLGTKDNLDVQHDYSVNLVFCIDDMELPTDKHKEEFKETMKELDAKTHRQLENSGNTKRETLKTIVRKTPTGVEIEFDNPIVKPYAKFFLPYRYSGTADYRTGLIHFTKIDPVIKKKIQERYNISEQGCIYGTFMVIFTPNANHNEYSLFNDYIYDNMRRIDELGEMFANPNTDINMLFRIIDDGIAKKELLLGNKRY